MGVDDSVSEGIGDGSSVGFTVGTSVAVMARRGTAADVDSGVGKLETGVEVQALIPKNKIIKSNLCLFIFFHSHLTAARVPLR